MESRVKVLGHPLHQILIVFPLGLLATAVVFDFVARFADDGRTAALVAHYMIGAGLIGGVLAAPPGWIDWFAIPQNTRARRVGLLHGLGNVVVLLLFFGSWWLRRGVAEDPGMTATVLSTAGALLALVTGWLGGELVDRLGVGVTPGAHLDAPSSLTHKSVPAAGETGAPPR
jgi:uncharacterized membrane protein